MSKADRLKEEIGWLKVVSSICAAVDASLIAWLVQNYERANAVLTVSAACFARGLIGIIIAAVMRVHRCIKLLEAS